VYGIAYVDDALNSGMEVFYSVLFNITNEYCRNINLELSQKKHQKAFAGPELHKMNEIGQWQKPVKELYVGLGKTFDIDARCIRDKPCRLPQMTELVNSMKEQATVRKSRLNDMLLTEKAIGLAQYIALTEPAVKGLLQLPIRSLSAKTGLSRVSTFMATGSLAPFPLSTEHAWDLILVHMKQNRGITFFQDLSVPTPYNTLVCMHDAAGAKILRDGTVIKAKDSYRARATLFWDPSENTL